MHLLANPLALACGHVHNSTGEKEPSQIQNFAPVRRAPVGRKTQRSVGSREPNWLLSRYDPRLGGCTTLLGLHHNLHIFFLVFQLMENLSPYPLYVVASDL